MCQIVAGDVFGDPEFSMTTDPTDIFTPYASEQRDAFWGEITADRNYAMAQRITVTVTQDASGQVVKNCTTCGQLKTADAFAKQAGGQLGRMAKCKACKREYDAKRSDTWRGSVHVVVQNTKSSSKRRQGKNTADGPRKMAPSDATVRMVADKLKAQMFLCAISCFRLEPRTLSPDRIDNDVTYTTDNFHMVHLAFQVASASPQWNRAAYNSIPDLRLEVATIAGLIELARAWYQHRDDKIVMCHGSTTLTFARQRDVVDQLGVHDGNLSQMLNPAKKVKSVGGFDPRDPHNPEKTLLWTGYRVQRVPQRDTVPALFIKMQSMIKDARHHTTERNERIGKANAKHEGEPGYVPVALHADVAVDEGDLLELLRAQGGRCAYADIPLQLDGERMMSLERLSRDEGYVPGNVALIVHRLNTSHFQWSRQLAEDTWKRPSPALAA